MRMAVLIALISFLLSLGAPLSLTVQEQEYSGDPAFMVLDVCHEGQSALSTNGGMPLISLCPYEIDMPAGFEKLHILPQPQFPSLSIPPEVAPPRLFA